MRGVARLLEVDLAAARSSGAPAAGESLLVTLSDLARERRADVVSLSVALDGRPVAGAPFARALSNKLRRLTAGDASRGEAPGLRVVVAEPAALGVALDLRTAGERLRATARVSAGTGVRHIALPGTWPIPGRASLLPPLVAVVLALALRRTLVALFAGIYVGAVLHAASGGAGVFAPIRGLWDLLAVYFLRELTDTFRIEIIAFIVLLLAMVGVMTRAGGVRGLVERFLSLARSARASLLLTWGMGLAIFFDDYANCMLVGNTMRPLTDRLRVPREKLAYVVDSTAAPVAGLALLSTWIAFLISLYSADLPAVGIAEGPYAIFLRTLPYRYYSWLALFFVLLVVLTGRDFGPMARAEARARLHDQVVRPGARPPISDALSHLQPAPHMSWDWRRAAFPLLGTVIATLLTLFASGGAWEWLLRDPARLLTASGLVQAALAGSGASAILVGGAAGLWLAAFLAGSLPMRVALLAGGLLALGLGGPFGALLAVHVEGSAARLAAPALLFGAGAAAGALVSRALGVATRRAHLSARELARAASGGAGALRFAVVLLFAAWMIGAVCRDLATADYLVALLSDRLEPGWLPLLLFGLAGAVAFSTGSSWSTLSILIPNVVVLAASLGAGTPLGPTGMVVLCIGAVFEGSIFGDHCSPISDTTVLSSVASSCDHIDHVRTQAPYALWTAGAAVVCGYLPTLLLVGWPPGLGLLAGAALLAAALRLVGRRGPAGALADDGIVQ